MPRGMIRRITGVAHRYVGPDGAPPSGLAVPAAERALAESGVRAADLDLIIFAAISSDLLEPATAHVVSARLGATCPAFDVKNACNGFLSGLETGDALIRTGAYRRVLVCCGERLTPFASVPVTGPGDFMDSMARYTISDTGAAVLLEAADEPGLLGFDMRAVSSAWTAGAVPLPGAPWRTPPRRFDLPAMTRTAFGLATRPPTPSGGHPAAVGADVSLCCAHIANEATAEDVCAAVGIPRARLTTTITTHGNTGSATLPLQLDLALREGRVSRGDTVLLVGVASGVSLGFLRLRL
ncbi:3-oxoacyl-ACP synthase III family protein [Streptomyces sp. NPDC021100]|uniref:3-oxoacyl-ACP synthase III family protein n=1 Tax=Streptomyces sp. NPDC021100 TaxID=3365114 RepID=UPI0037934DAD